MKEETYKHQEETQAGCVGHGFHHMKHRLDETVMKAKGVFHSNSHRLHYNPVESTVQLGQDLTTVGHSRVPVSTLFLPLLIGSFCASQRSSRHLSPA